MHGARSWCAASYGALATARDAARKSGATVHAGREANLVRLHARAWCGRTLRVPSWNEPAPLT